MHMLFQSRIFRSLSQSLGLTGAIFWACFILFLSGCISVPPAPQRNSGKREEMFEHVAFLSQAALKGRKSRTLGSRAARQYIEARFKACGLVPWNNSSANELGFNY